jgi:hypothetical protein
MPSMLIDEDNTSDEALVRVTVIDIHVFVCDINQVQYFNRG